MGIKNFSYRGNNLSIPKRQLQAAFFCFQHDTCIKEYDAYTDKNKIQITDLTEPALKKIPSGVPLCDAQSLSGSGKNIAEQGMKTTCQNNFCCYSIATGLLCYDCPVCKV